MFAVIWLSSRSSLHLVHWDFHTTCLSCPTYVNNTDRIKAYLFKIRIPHICYSITVWQNALRLSWVLNQTKHESSENLFEKYWTQILKAPATTVGLWYRNSFLHSTWIDYSRSRATPSSELTTLPLINRRKTQRTNSTASSIACVRSQPTRSKRLDWTNFFDATNFIDWKYER